MKSEKKRETTYGKAEVYLNRRRPREERNETAEKQEGEAKSFVVVFFLTTLSGDGEGARTMPAPNLVTLGLD
ncbi:hypothetical protein B296_00021694 [Ensete ventricosum]|uniref:Uncharacterized protein n=1 Tax=Ensete ventricosum TaxID=4639 RepID=A0A426ZDV3_ENSVE|nr:hypothetical protein B296_00021694 [Ensete ventricosum]